MHEVIELDRYADEVTLSGSKTAVYDACSLETVKMSFFLVLLILLHKEKDECGNCNIRISQRTAEKTA